MLAKLLCESLARRSISRLLGRPALVEGTRSTKVDITNDRSVLPEIHGHFHKSGAPDMDPAVGLSLQECPKGGPKFVETSASMPIDCT